MSLLLATALLAGSAAAADEFLSLVRKADSRAESEERVEYYSRAIRAWSPVHARTLLAHCHFGRGQARFLEFELEHAEADLSKAILHDPRNSGAYLLRGRVHLFRGRHAKAVRDFAEFNATAPHEEAEGFWRLGEAAEGAGRAAEAQKAYERAVELDPDDVRPALGTIRLALARRRTSEALAGLEKLGRRPGQPAAELLLLKAVALAQSGRPGAALPEASRAIELLEGGLVDGQRSEIAPVELMETRLALAKAYRERGLILESLLKPWEALSDYREACKLDDGPSCRKAESLARKTPAPEPAAPRTLVEPPARHAVPVTAPAPAEEKPADPKPALKKRKAKKPGSDPGDRIYAN